MESIKRNAIIALTVAIIVILAAAVGLLIWKGFPSVEKMTGNKKAEVAEPTGDMKARQGEEAAKETQKLIDEVKEIAKDIKPDKVAEVVTFTKTDENGSTTKEQAVVIAPGANPISMETGEVLTRDGAESAHEDARAGDPNAPIQSDPVAVEQLPESTIQISLTPTSATPKEFTVKPKQAVALAVTAAGATLEIFKFVDPELSAVAMGLMPGETRTITFNAPEKPGEYIFYSDFMGHRKAGAEGKMIVK